MAVEVGRRNIPDTPQNRQLDACTQARKFAIHTLRICQNKNIFDPEYQETLINDLVETAKDIFINVDIANNIRVAGSEGRWLKRYNHQITAIEKCRRMTGLIALTKEAFHLRSKKVNYWIDMLFDTQELIEGWNTSDIIRYSTV